MGIFNKIFGIDKESISYETLLHPDKPPSEDNPTVIRRMNLDDAQINGNAETQFWVGDMYMSSKLVNMIGSKVSKDEQKAARWYQLAANQGLAKAQYKVGFVYDKGVGVTQDYEQALKWYRLAADQGIDSAMTNIGEMYREGRGVLQDDEEAVKWYQRAAEQGSAIAQTNLGASYMEGKGVKQNNVISYMWFNVAAMSGDEFAAKGLEIVKKTLTPQQLEEAEKLSKECVKNNYKEC